MYYVFCFAITHYYALRVLRVACVWVWASHLESALLYRKHIYIHTHTRLWEYKYKLYINNT